MLRLSNIRIGYKLAAMSIIGIVLVIGMIALEALKGEKTADWPSAKYGRPPMMCGFHSGMWGSVLRE